MDRWSEQSVEYLRTLARGFGKQDELSEKSGIKVPTLQNILSGKTEPSVGKVAALAGTFGVSVDEIIAGGPRFGAVGHGSTSANASNQSWGAMPGESITLPALADVRASAGDGSLVDLEGLTPGPFTFNEQWLRSQFGSLSGLRLVQVAGDSQQPDLHDGDWIVIDESRSTLQNGLYVIVLDDCLMLKRIQLEGKFVQLMSRNPIYSGIGIDLSKEADRLKIVGRTVYSFRAMG